MAQPYVYRGDPRDYHWLGHVEDGAVAYFEHRPPDERWQPHEATVADDAALVDPLRTQQQDEAIAATGQAGTDAEVKQPNKAASAEDWKAYALAHGGFQDATGTHPDDATRKAIVDHYTAGDPATPDADANPAGGEPANAPQE
jgi:hypothetical protein